MPNPVPPSTIKGLVPAITDKLCAAMTKALLAFPAAVYRWWVYTFNEDQTVTAAAKQDYNYVQTGMVIQSACLIADTAEWLPCSGGEYSRVTYKRLFDKIGGSFGGGDNTTTFNVPNVVDRFVIGAGSTVGVAGTGGEASVTLTVDQLPAHHHGIASKILDGTDQPSAIAKDDDVSTSNPGETEDTGGGEAHENRPPFIGFYHYIKT